MNIKTFSDFGFIIVENVYDNNELELIWKDIDKLCDENLLKSPQETGAASDYFTGKLLKNNYGTYLDSLYKERKINFLLPLSEKFFENEITEAVASLSNVHELYRNVNLTGNLISYYENSHYYGPHTDQAVFTILIWFHKEPKIWDGGILKFSEMNVEVEPKNNRAIIFPSSFLHEVSPVQMKETKSGYGRFTVTHFCFIQPKF